MKLETIDAHAVRRIAVLYQALPPPLIDGLRKDAKPGGYSDSGADIAFCLRESGHEVVTPTVAPDASTPMDWVFPDTAEGLARAVAAGATVFWANTVLFRGHPIEAYLSRTWIVGQCPARQQDVDDKFTTNQQLRTAGLPVVCAVRVAHTSRPGVLGLNQLDEARLDRYGLRLPLTVKPIRGRGSQGVSRVDSVPALKQAVAELIDGGTFGDTVIVEQYLAGEELTVTVMPSPPTRGHADAPSLPRVLPPVRRFNHIDGIAPYNGLVAVTQNSAALSEAQADAPAVQTIKQACAETFRQIGALGAIRIDCRADADGVYRIFDVNMKPNMTGAGRPGREAQDSLSAIAARALGWPYAELLQAMLDGAWRAV